MTDFDKRLGYGGSAAVAGVQVLITGGGMEESSTPSFLEMMDIPPQDLSRSRTLHADGTVVYTGNVSFDVTNNALTRLTTSTLLKRRYQFEVGIHDGENWARMQDCYLTSLSLSGSPGGFIAAALGFMAVSAKDTGAVDNDYLLEDYYGATPATDNQPVGYWWSGGPSVRDWTLNMTQMVEPIYGNKNETTPLYLLVGLVEYSLDVVLYDELTTNSVNIMTTSFTLSGVTMGKGYTYNGTNDLGMYSYSFSTAADAVTGAGGLIIT